MHMQICMRDKLKTFAKILLVIVCCSMSCGCYIFERRNGEFFDSTKAIWSDGLFSDSWIPPTLGDFICLFGFAAFNVGGFLTFQAGLAVKGVEMCVVAPAYDVYGYHTTATNT